ncbi:uncharacterized protein Z520_10803 [Fonsecaea multimorphosa CBS 102226]|uniref:Zn(2)-C6 fungal-type domain-containing protein n=1 Tax=Fonsecaea multimorphosa CBS 102226 TaxID=1442371 RepID=A0A0D2JSI2_9EURO|nr:uncharacterized protein Z520_10803 [Fonsecaea multimorphosa CBS 102226]KIX93384.1 hypothetical protein Z520_10803 [Fonsecaea multimorphosa CBS 102226]OAL18684.1 hypothetical protein AYO22_10377 [Fonsecaea multimorphosa]
MSQMLAPRPPQGGEGSQEPPSSQRPRKISTACGACKQRKTKCSGGNPCEACATRKSLCIYDATSDQRRKIANHRTAQELVDKQLALERHQQLLGGIIATVRAGGFNATEDLLRVIRSGVELSQLAAHVRNECRANIAIQQAYEQIEFVIDGGTELPSPAQMQVLPNDESRGSAEEQSDASSIKFSSSGRPKMDRPNPPR